MIFAAALLAYQQSARDGMLWALSGGAFLVLIVGASLVFLLAIRRLLHGERAKPEESLSLVPKSSTGNPAAFMTASMQAVIGKLREQEKELAALHRSERERAQQTERLSEAVTRNMPAGLLLVNAAGLITSSNPAAETTLGVRGLGFRHYDEVLGSDSPLSRLVGGCLASGRTYRREEIVYSTPGGEARKLGVTISPILNQNGQVAGAICLLSDLTELAALQRQVQMKESLAALGELSAGIAHEFKNALATISGYAQMIRSEAEGEQSENARLILEQTRSLARVVTEFLKFARPLDLASEEVALQPLTERVISETRDAFPGVELTAEGELATVSGDESLLRQALLNLTRNAAEAVSAREETRHDGTNGHRAGCVVLRGSIECSGPHPVQRISIADTGPGIPEEQLPRIFVPFYTTKPSGTGLGLAIVQKIILQHGGSVEARNRTEGGAELIVQLPLVRTPAAAVDSLSRRA